MLVGVTALVAAAIAVSACGDDPPGPVRCKNIATGGCPLSSVDACKDTSCTAIYACEPSGRWVLDHPCAGNDGGSSAVVMDAQPLDAPTGVPTGKGGGCIDLEPPDCPVDRALGCGTGCCDCEDLFVCNNGTWSPWGTCSDAGVRPLLR